MKKLVLLLAVLFSAQSVLGAEVLLPNLRKNATGTTTGSKHGLDVYVSGGSLGSVTSGSSAAVGDTGTPSLAIRKDADGILSGVDDMEYTPLQVDSTGRLKVDAAIAEVATAADGSNSQPALTKVVSGWDGSNVQTIKTDSTGSIQVDVESSALPSGAATAANQATEIASLASIDGKIANNYGAAGSAVRTASQVGNASGVADFNAGNASAQTLRTVIATDQSAIPASQSGTWNIADITGTVSLPTGAATAARQDTGNTSLGNIDTDTTTIATNTGTTATNTTSIDGKIANNYGAATGAVRTAAQIGNATAVADFNAGNASAQTLRTVIATDQSAIPSSQSGTWSVRTQDGSGNALTSNSIGSKRGLNTSPVGKSSVDKARNDYSSVNVTTGAYVQLIASTAAEADEVEIFDSSGQTLFLATGGAGAETNQVYIFPGGNGRIPLRIASGTRISVKAVSGTASTGEIDINLYGN